jgi:hypothetical protein
MKRVLASVYDAPQKGRRPKSKKADVGTIRPKKLSFPTSEGRRRMRERFAGPEFVDWGRTNGGYGPHRDKSSWIAALREFNKNNKNAYCTPKRDSPEYRIVRAIQARFKAGGMDATKDVPAGMRLDSYSRLSKVPVRRKTAAQKAKEERENYLALSSAALKRQVAREKNSDATIEAMIKGAGTWKDAPAPKTKQDYGVLDRAHVYKHIFDPRTDASTRRYSENKAAGYKPETAIRALEYLIGQYSSTGIFEMSPHRDEVVAKARAEIARLGGTAPDIVVVSAPAPPPPPREISVVKTAVAKKFFGRDRD